MIVLFLTACQPSPGIIQTAIAQTVAAYTPTPEPIIDYEDDPNMWRIRPMEGSKDFYTDISGGKLFTKSIEFISNDLAIEKPFRWETYTVQESIKFKDIAFYYTRILRDQKYAIERYDYWPEKKLGLSIFSSPIQTVYLEVWEANTEFPRNGIFVIYKEVE